METQQTIEKIPTQNGGVGAEGEEVIMKLLKDKFERHHFSDEAKHHFRILLPLLEHMYARGHYINVLNVLGIEVYGLNPDDLVKNGFHSAYRDSAKNEIARIKSIVEDLPSPMEMQTEAGTRIVASLSAAKKMIKTTAYMEQMTHEQLRAHGEIQKLAKHFDLDTDTISVELNPVEAERNQGYMHVYVWK